VGSGTGRTVLGANGGDARRWREQGGVKSEGWFAKMYEGGYEMSEHSGTEGLKNRFGLTGNITECGREKVGNIEAGRGKTGKKGQKKFKSIRRRSGVCGSQQQGKRRVGKESNRSRHCGQREAWGVRRPPV